MIRVLVCLALFIISRSAECKPVDILYLETSSRPQAIPESLEAAASFYGVRIVPLLVDSADFRASVRHALQAASTVAVVIDAYAMELLGDCRFKELLASKGKRPQPILVMGVTGETSRSLDWIPGLRGRLDGCRTIRTAGSRFIFSPIRELNHQLAGLELTLAESSGWAFPSKAAAALQPIISIRNGDTVSPVFLRTSYASREVFVGAEWKSPKIRDGEATSLKVQVGGAVIPLVFLRYAAGRYGWHSAGSYANLTIDDPWLIEPYGFLQYAKLLKEMEVHRFHTTIAFIPWNFDRSHAEVATLFRTHSDKYSICIHGNNHDHREFGPYSYKTLRDQQFNVRQAVARMEHFRELTGLPYDRVMVFPHGISPAPTLRTLKSCGFLATVNAVSIPLNQNSRPQLSLSLRSTTLYEAFPSAARYSAEYSVSEYPHKFPVPREVIAVNAFLGNPILMYGHQGMFASGIGAFNDTAEFVNEIERAVKWRSLGYVMAHSYLQKARLEENHTYDVLTYSSRTCLENPDSHGRRFYVRKQEDGLVPIRSVKVDGNIHPFEIVDGHLTTSMALGGGQTACLDIEYMNEESEPAGVSKSSIRVLILRMVSDWRDLYLSRFSLGRFIIAAYYGNESKRDKAIISLAGAGCAGSVACLWLLRRRLTRRANIPPTRPAAQN